MLSNSAWSQQNLETMNGDQRLPSGVREDSKVLPGDNALPPNVTNAQIEAARQAFQQNMSSKFIESISPLKEQPVTNKTIRRAKTKKVNSKPVEIPIQPRSASGVETFNPVAHLSDEDSNVTIFEPITIDDTITLPAGASAYATLMFGQQIALSKPEEISARLDYAFLGPNNAVVELKGCMVFLELGANFSLGKLKGGPKDLTCRSASGTVFTVPMSGLIVDSKDEYAGAQGTLELNGQFQAAGLKFVTSLQEGYGQAMQTVQKTVSAVASEKSSEKIENVTGSKNDFVKGKVLENTSRFLDKVIMFYENMEPTLALAPGTKIHVVNRTNIQIPRDFFEVRDGDERDHK